MRTGARFPYMLGFRTSIRQKNAVEIFADANRLTLGEAGRAILDAGIKVLGIQVREERGEVGKHGP
jgi:hypothetical protein